MAIVVTGVGVVSALGVGVERNLASLREGASGISQHPTLLKTSHRLPVGELNMSNEELHNLLGISPREHLSRTALLGILAVREALQNIDMSNPTRIGLVSSTSVVSFFLYACLFSKI